MLRRAAVLAAVTGTLGLPQQADRRCPIATAVTVADQCRITGGNEQVMEATHEFDAMTGYPPDNSRVIARTVRSQLAIAAMGRPTYEPRDQHDLVP
jgi:hypothetical protein